MRTSISASLQLAAWTAMRMPAPSAITRLPAVPNAEKHRILGPGRDTGGSRHIIKDFPHHRAEDAIGHPIAERASRKPAEKTGDCVRNMKTVALRIIVILSMTAGCSANGDEGNPRVIDPGIHEATHKQRARVRIMPLGDSITYENHQGDERPTGERIAYRFRLGDLLERAGRAVDFVGNRNAGLNYFTDPDDADNAGFPGIKTDELSLLVATGDGGPNWENQAPGPYLDHHPADIILLHIGTNGVDPGGWNHVERIVDTIDQWEKAPGNNPVTTIVARIIDRWPHSVETTAFNDNVESMIRKRYAAGDKVILVDMEAGAAIDYMLEMDDKLHPRRSGYGKMAEQWFPAVEAIMDGRPYVALRNPLHGADCDVGTRVALEADVYFPDGPVDRVEFTVDGVTISEDATAPFTATWTVPSGRCHEVKAVAFFRGSSRSESRPVVVNPWRILTLGDGITQGEYGHDSYRYGLWKRLVDNQVPFRFVGSIPLLKGEVLGYWREERKQQIRHEYPPHGHQWFDQDRYHEGHWGWSADEILHGSSSAHGAGCLPEWLTGYTADVALVHLGTADVMQGRSASATAADIEKVIATLRADNAGIAVLLAKLMPTTDEAHNRAIEALNARIDEIAALSTAASPVIVVDQNTGFDAARDTYDGIHPNASGEARLAEAWFRPLAALLGGSPELAGQLARTQPSREAWEATEFSLNHTRTH